jgi:ankyrin repeat protein
MKKQVLLILLLTLCLVNGFNCKNNFPLNEINAQVLQKGKDEELIEAVKNNNSVKVEELLKTGADANACEQRFAESPRDCYPVLGLAVDEKNAQIARMLLENGANVDSRDLRYIEALKTALPSRHLNFAKAVMNQDVQMIKLLAEFNANMQKDEDSMPILCFAKNKEVLDLLIDYGFDINVRSKSDGKICLTDAIISGNVELVKAILSHRPSNLHSKTYALKVFDYQEMTSLQLAKLYGNREIIEALKKAGAKK